MNTMFIVTAIEDARQADAIMRTTQINGIMCSSVFQHQLETAARCLKKLEDVLSDNLSRDQVSDSEIKSSICMINDLINML